jgi:hypothetical protein
VREPTLWVVGAPRSGTSAVVRLLTLLGADAGDPRGHLNVSPELNPHGYFEQIEVIAVNNDLLAGLGGHVLFTPPPPAQGWELDPMLDPLRERATALLERLFERGPPVVKDPRLSLTLPFWLPLLRTPRVVVCVRDPAESLASQYRAFRGKVDIAHLGRRWLVYNASALVGSADIPRVLVRYDELVSRPAEEVDRLADLLGEPPPDHTARAAAADSIDPELRHRASGPVELPEGGHALYEALSTGGPEAALERATTLARELLEAERESFDWEWHARRLAGSLGASIARERHLEDWIENRERALEWHVEHRASMEAELEKLRAS